MTDREAAGRLALMAEGGTNFSRESGEACRMGAEAIREREERNKQLAAGAAPHTRTCPVCGAEFVPKSNHQVYCGMLCREEAARRRKAAKAAKKEYGKGTCPVCGEEFVKETGNQAYCSARCRQLLQNRQKAEARAAERRERQAAKKAPRRKKPGGQSAASIVREARKEGLSYGQYVAKYGV